jgi:bifunctional UDP-N-acetylglucosamine pyrophosphorylase/glucosamine-1-phosphate N-acetyltransferase
VKVKLRTSVLANRVAIILAAGVSSRMNTELAKVLHEVCGRPMLAYVIDACREVGIEKMYVVVGYGAEQVKERFRSADDIIWVRQAEQKGTAHAVLCCKEYLKDFQGRTDMQRCGW